MMYIIFVFSSQEADLSSSISHRASVVIVKTADYIFDLELEDWKIEDYAQRIHGVTRKLAHMTEYFLLAVAVSFPLYVYGLHGLLLVLVAGAICVGYACTDEYHQAFVAGRSASSKDVIIDSAGVLIGIILVRIIGWTGRHTIFRPLPDEKGRRQNRRELKRLKKQQAQMQRRLDEQQKRYEQDRAYGPDHDPRRDRAYGSDYNPRQDRAYGPDYDPRQDYAYDPDYDPRQDRAYGPDYDPRQDRAYDPDYDPRQDYIYDPDYDPRQDYAYDPDYEDIPGYNETAGDASSDELSDDMPLSRFLNRRRDSRRR